MFIQPAARGLLRCPDRDGYPAAAGMVAVHDTESGQRLPLRASTPFRKVVLIAVIDWPQALPVPAPAQLHHAEAGRLWVQLAAGRLVTEHTVPGLAGPDLIGCHDTTGLPWLEPEAIELVEDRPGVLEIHNGPGPQTLAAGSGTRPEQHDRPGAQQAPAAPNPSRNAVTGSTPRAHRTLTP